jgi:hypothetical protein
MKSVLSHIVQKQFSGDLDNRQWVEDFVSGDYVKFNDKMYGTANRP